MSDIALLKPYLKNAKKHSEKQIKQVANSIREFGFNQPIVVDKENVIIVGHARLEAAKLLGLTDVPVIQVDLDEQKAKAYRLADNKLNESDWEMGLVIEELKGLTPELLDLTGFDRDLLIEPDEKDDIVPDDAPPVAKLGDLWALGRHRLMCGDATKKEDVEALMGGNKADMVFTDPPYGIDYSGGRTQVVAQKTYGKMKGDANRNISSFIKAILDIAGNKDYYVCLSPINIKDVLPFFDSYEGIIVWKKPQPGLGYQWIRRYCEFIVFGTKRKKPKNASSEFDFWEISTDPKNEYQHGTQKPIALVSRAIKFSSTREDIVSDLFLGSGSTLIACEKTGRICYGMEIDPKYCNVIIKRWEDYVGNGAKATRIQ